MTHRIGLLLLCLLPVLARADVPRSLVEMLFDGDLADSGSLGGQAERTEYAPGEGPVYSLGVRGLGFSFEASSRAGGRDTTKAGGAALLDAPDLGSLTRFTLCAWLRPTDPGGPARVLYLPRRWDLFVTGDRAYFKVTSGGKDSSFGSPAGVAALPLDEWSFLAVVVDLEAATAVMYTAVPGNPLAAVGRWDSVPLPDAATGPLQIGNLEGIRPFRGRMDNLRIFGAALAESEVGAVYEADQIPQRSLKDRVVPPPAGNFRTLRHSDVCFSTRWARDNAVEALRAFGANRVVWVYTESADFARAIHDTGATLQCAINSIPQTDDLSAYCVDLDGTMLVAPWMVTFSKDNPPKWGCNNQPAFRQAVLDKAKKALDAGADWMQFDDWSLIASAHSWGGGCMCDRCMEAFREYLAELPAETLRELGIESLDGFDYRDFLAREHGIHDAAAYKQRRGELATTPPLEDFQRRSVREYFVGLRAALDEHAGRRVPLSINASLTNPSQRASFLADLVDFFLGETSATTLEDLAVCAATADALGKPQIVSPFPHNVSDARLALAATYALGQYYLVPWDVWMGPEKPRHFGTVEDYGDLFHFVRDNPGLLDDYEAPGVVGVVVDTDRYDAGRMRSVVGKVLRARVPFCFVLLGRKYYHVPLDPQRLARFAALICLDEFESYAEEDRAALASVAHEVGRLSDRQATPDLLSRLAPVQVWGPEDVYVLPRVSLDPADRTLILHVLNRVREAEGQPVVPLRYLSVGLRGEALLGARVESATWHAPGEETRELEVDDLPTGPRLIIPELRRWGIARVRFAAP